MAMTSEFVDMTSSPTFFEFVLFLLSSLVTVQVLCQYHHWLWSHDNFFFCTGLTRNPEIGNIPV